MGLIENCLQTVTSEKFKKTVRKIFQKQPYFFRIFEVKPFFQNLAKMREKQAYLVFLLCEDEVGHSAEREAELHDFPLGGVAGNAAEMQHPRGLACRGVQLHL